jgi:hypothetical protein
MLWVLVDIYTTRSQTPLLRNMLCCNTRWPHSTYGQPWNVTDEGLRVIYYAIIVPFAKYLGIPLTRNSILLRISTAYLIEPLGLMTTHHPHPHILVGLPHAHHHLHGPTCLSRTWAHACRVMACKWPKRGVWIQMWVSRPTCMCGWPKKFVVV